MSSFKTQNNHHGSGTDIPRRGAEVAENVAQFYKCSALSAPLRERLLYLV